MQRESLPQALQGIIQQAEDTVRRAPQHELPPSYRWAIYVSLGSLGDPQTGYMRANLALASAKRALGIWKQEQPDNTWPEQLIGLSEEVLKGDVRVETGRNAAEAAFEELAALAQNLDQDLLSTRAQSAALAAIEALFEASGVYAFNSNYDYTGQTDRDLDPWTSDAALHAANAIAGAIWEPSSDSEKREEFWNWWLERAIPSVWYSSHE